ncbi:hypothetical protein [Ktedonobacter sp. SOSP1-52]|uniref:hypothetical protein n=1 Tax=Ktedonobacter sp. SOSP1-52 TaxID=2778366 RepID=UPI001F179F4A|nr:hypothetical protein [Ktedonobacter sp. SOSP1-52]
MITARRESECAGVEVYVGVSTSGDAGTAWDWGVGETGMATVGGKEGSNIEFVSINVLPAGTVRPPAGKGDEE